MKPATPRPKPKRKRKRSALGPLAIAGALVLALLGAGGYYLATTGDKTRDTVSNWIPALPSEAPSETPTEPAPTLAPASSIAEGLQVLAREAAAADAPGARAVEAAAARAVTLDPATQAEPLTRLARSTSAALATALAREAGERTARVEKLAPWAKRPTEGATAQQRSMAATLQRAKASVIVAASRTRDAGEPEQAVAAARSAVADYGRFIRIYARAYTLARAAPALSAPAATQAIAAAPTPTAAALPISKAQLAARVSEFREVHNSAKSVANQVVAIGRDAKPRSSYGEAAQAAYRLRQDNAARARQYADHLDALARSLRGAKTDAAAQSIVAQARTVRGYLVTLQARSAAAMPPRR